MDERSLEILLASALTLFVFYIATWLTSITANLETLIFVLFGIAMGTLIFYRFKDRDSE